MINGKVKGSQKLFPFEVRKKNESRIISIFTKTKYYSKTLISWLKIDTVF